MGGTAQGEITKKFGEELVKILDEREFKVFYDHGNSQDKHVCEPRLYFRNSFLAVADIVILNHDNKVKVICEIEEKGATPKKIIGDIVDIFLADRIRIKYIGDCYFDNPYFILGIIKNTKRADELKKRAQDIKNQIQSIIKQHGVEIDEPIYKSKTDELWEEIKKKILGRCKTKVCHVKKF